MKKGSLWKIAGAVCALLWMSQAAAIAAENERPPFAVMGMLRQEVADTLPGIREIKPELYKLRIDLPNETIYELVGTEEGLGWSMAIADIVQTAPHYHRDLSETYIVVSGLLEVTVDDKSYVMRQGDVMVIPTNAVHSARSLTDEPARILVSCVPGWTPEDHTLIK